MSPIRKERAALYGRDWSMFSDRIRFTRARGRCECRGECGHRHETRRKCAGRCPGRHGDILLRGGKLVLTVAHLCHDESCRDESHVRAMCQRCHLRYDAYHHARNASATRDRKYGQERLALGVRAGGTEP